MTTARMNAIHELSHRCLTVVYSMRRIHLLPNSYRYHYAIRSEHLAP